MRVVFFTGFTTWKPHFETELELIQRHLDDNDDVIQLSCNGGMLACDANPHHDRQVCARCCGIRCSGNKLLDGRITVRDFIKLNPKNHAEIRQLPTNFDQFEDLRDLRIDNFDVGYGILSSLISNTRDHNPDLVFWKNLVGRLLTTSLAVYRSIQNLIDEEKVDRIYAFNGRFAFSRAVLRACQSRNVPCFLHERGCDLRHYEVFENVLPHDIFHVEREVRKAWEREPDVVSRSEIAARFFIERREGAVQSWHSFVTDQIPGLLPGDWNPAKKNIVIFNSSEDEFVAIGDQYLNSIYSSQQDALIKIISAVEANPNDLHLYLRCHPNLKNLENTQTRELQRLSSPVFTNIPPESPISSYALIDNASKVVSFASTAGIEAAFWGRPSILAGPSFYQNLGATYNPRSHCEVVELIQRELDPLDKTGALMYGYYMKTFGTKFKYYHPSGVASGEFKGTVLQPSPNIFESALVALNKIPDFLFNSRARLRLTGWPLNTNK